MSIGLFTAYTIAEMAYHVYEKEAHQACHDIAEGKLTKAVEDIAYLNVAVAGIVSGVSKGFGQTALGHETYELVRTHFTQEAKPTCTVRSWPSATACSWPSTAIRSRWHPSVPLCAA